MSNYQHGVQKSGLKKFFIVLTLFLGIIFLFSMNVTAVSNVSDNTHTNLTTAKATSGLADSPWPKYKHDNQNTGQSNYPGPLTNRLKWKYSCSNWIRSSPAIGSDGTIYFGDETGVFYALKSNGTLKWKYKAPNIYISDPAVGSDGTIYFGDGNKLIALNPDGTKKWIYSDFNDRSVAIGSDGTLYFGSSYNNFVALNPNGTKKWGYKFSSTGFYRGYPAIGNDGTIYFTTNAGSKSLIKDDIPYGVYALYPNGKLKWSYRAGDFSSPVIGKDGNIYLGNFYDFFTLTSEGKLKWKSQIGRWNEMPTLSKDGTIYFTSEGYLGTFYHALICLNKNGTLKWQFSSKNDSYFSPIVDSNGTLYYCYSNSINALNPDKTLKWTYKVNSTHYIDYPKVSILGKNNTLYFTSNRDIYALQDFKVSSVDPANGAINVPVNKIININFTDPIKAGTTFKDISVKSNGGTILPITISINGNVLTIKLTRGSYVPGTQYIITLPANCVRDLAGYGLKNAFTSHFNTSGGADDLAVVSFDPSNGTIKVPLNKTIKVIFNKSVKPGTLYKNIMVKSSSGKLITITKTIKDNILYITQNSLTYASNTKYIINIPTSSVTDLANHILKRTYTSSFTTEKNLVVTSVKAPPTGKIGAKIYVINSVKNQGTTIANNFYVKYYLTPTKSISATKYFIGQRKITNLSPGKTNTQSTPLTIPSTTLKGSYYIAAVADSTRVGYSTTKIKVT